MTKLIWFISAALFAVGCNRGNTSAGGSAATQPTEVRLGFFPNVTHAQAVLGVASGDFASAVAPSKFEPRQFNAGPSLIEALFAGEIDIGYVGPGPVINAFARSQGQGIRVISGAAANGVLIVARKGSGIKTMADLKEKRIATPQHGNTQDIATRHYLMATLGQADTDNVQPINNADQLGMMQRGQIDAAWTPEPWGSLLVSQGKARVVGEEKDLWPEKDFSLTVIVTTPEFLAAHADVVEKMLGVNRKWTNELNANSAGCVSKLESVLAELTGKPLPAGLVADSLKYVKFTEQPSPATFIANSQWAVDLGFAKHKLDLNGLIDQSVQQKIPASK